MTDRGEVARLADIEWDEITDQPDDRHLATSALDCSANRIEQLGRLRAKLSVGQPLTESDVALAHRRAE